MTVKTRPLAWDEYVEGGRRYRLTVEYVAATTGAATALLLGRIGLNDIYVSADNPTRKILSLELVEEESVEPPLPTEPGSVISAGDDRLPYTLGLDGKWRGLYGVFSADDFLFPDSTWTPYTF